MYITDVLTRTKKGEVSHRCTLLRESYREKGKIKTRTIANLTHCNPEEIQAIRLALAHKADLSVLGSLNQGMELKQGQSVGAVWTVYEIAKRLGIEKALGGDKEGKLALWQVIARVIDQGSRLSAVRLAQTHAACDVLGIRGGFDENDLYQNLSWLTEHQRKIEKRLFHARYKGAGTDLFLYDVTSSYLEGMHNQLSAWGYNRDKKKGKKQVVVGLLCDECGDPVSVEVFKGNTRDFHTFGDQVEKVANLFGCKRVTMVGDRGMIKSAQIEQLKGHFHYITAITKPQIEVLLREGVFQFELFDSDVCEVAHEGIRYILRRNPHRARQMRCIRDSKKNTIEELVLTHNIYLTEHPRAKVHTALNRVTSKIASLKLDTWLEVKAAGKILYLQEDKAARTQQEKWDGCYVIKSDLPHTIDTHTIHDRYKDLAKVEQAFRTCKTGLLELRPWYVRTRKSTRGHALVVMLGYLVAHYLEKAWAELEVTVKEGLNQLSTVCSMEMVIEGRGSTHRIPKPRMFSAKLLAAAHVRLPHVLPQLGARVVSRKKLATKRKTH
jgi:hypothetical protein